MLLLGIILTCEGVLIRFKDGKFTVYSKKEELPGNRINIVREDRHGNIWVDWYRKGCSA
jgi:sugar lactone lactonase YvrE